MVQVLIGGKKVNYDVRCSKSRYNIFSEPHLLRTANAILLGESDTYFIEGVEKKTTEPYLYFVQAPKADVTFPREEFDAKVEKYLEILEKIGSGKEFTYYKCEYNCVIKGRTNIIVAVLEDEKDGVCEVCGQKKCNK